MVGCLVVALLAGLLWLVPGAQAQRAAAVSIALALQPSSITADGTSTSTATVTVNDGIGTGVPGETITLSSSDPNEQISAVSDNGDGTYTATITSSTTVGAPTITASDQAAALTTTKNLTQTPGAPANIGLSLRPSSITANGASTSTAIAILTDASGNRIPGQAVAFSSTDANESISGVTDNGNGTYTATITSSTTPGTPTITVSDGGLTAQQTLTQTPGPAANIAVAVQPPVIKADGASTATATATVTDAFGNPVSGDPVNITSLNPGDTVFGLTQNGNVYTAFIRSSFAPGNSTIVATDTATRAHGQTVLKEVTLSSAISLVSSPSSAATNQNVTLVAPVSGPGSPAGTIDFFDGFTPISGCTGLPVSPGSPTAVCLTSFAASSSPVALTAVFTPNSSSTVAGSSASTSLPVGKDSTSISLRPTAPALNVGASDTVTAYVAPTLSGGAAPTGGVEFENGTSPIPGCKSVPLTTSFGGYTAACKVSYQTVGTRRVNAIFSGDQNFSGSSSTVQIPVVPRGFLPVTMQWSWGWGARSTGVSQLQVNALSLGTSLFVSCRGHGCAFSKRRTTLRRGGRCTPTGSHKCGTHSSTVDLAALFRGHRLAVGTQIVVEIRRAGWVGKYYSFTMRSRRGPLIRTLCLAPGSTKPGVNCSR